MAAQAEVCLQKEQAVLMQLICIILVRMLLSGQKLSVILEIQAAGQHAGGGELFLN
jgi:hypothetical protein